VLAVAASLFKNQAAVAPRSEKCSSSCSVLWEILAAVA